MSTIDMNAIQSWAHQLIDRAAADLRASGQQAEAQIAKLTSEAKSIVTEEGGVLKNAADTVKDRGDVLLLKSISVANYALRKAASAAGELKASGAALEDAVIMASRRVADGVKGTVTKLFED
jgi:hypothetical protein